MKVAHLLIDRDSGSVIGAASTSAGIRDLFFRHCSVRADIEHCAPTELLDSDIPVVARIELDSYNPSMIRIGIDVLRGWLGGKI